MRREFGARFSFMFLMLKVPKGFLVSVRRED